jgi:hypothetical protein
MKDNEKIEKLKLFLEEKIIELQKKMNKSKKGLYCYVVDKAKRDVCKEILEKL